MSTPSLLRLHAMARHSLTLAPWFRPPLTAKFASACALEPQTVSSNAQAVVKRHVLMLSCKVSLSKGIKGIREQPRNYVVFINPLIDTRVGIREYNSVQ